MKMNTNNHFTDAEKKIMHLLIEKIIFSKLYVYSTFRYAYVKYRSHVGKIYILDYLSIYLSIYQDLISI